MSGRWKGLFGVKTLCCGRKTGLGPLTNTDSSDDGRGDDRQGDTTSNGQVPLVLRGFLSLVPAVDLREGEAPGEKSLAMSKHHQKTLVNL